MKISDLMSKAEIYATCQDWFMAASHSHSDDPLYERIGFYYAPADIDMYLSRLAEVGRTDITRERLERMVSQMLVPELMSYPRKSEKCRQCRLCTGRTSSIRVSRIPDLMTHIARLRGKETTPLILHEPTWRQVGSNNLETILGRCGLIALMRMFPFDVIDFLSGRNLDDAEIQLELHMSFDNPRTAKARVIARIAEPAMIPPFRPSWARRAVLEWFRVTGNRAIVSGDMRTDPVIEHAIRLALEANQLMSL